ncbi:nicotinate-nucleotide adenylyltransferase [Bacillus pakistanensis]|uniref:Probable nicotinate-nucleotide adenylyltransferase n=1 Tax=Rossellomorea pakistanensis TaxID=992288 RepID=A0ABS2NAA5_9BACI|nr:nicotinate-nucleotide adenylyltransferase [Bacillus pakistanensis]MBM7584755.1 nicotinate-nucleotide adenylyltransferase [Bacillus pakistanensis]
MRRVGLLGGTFNPPHLGHLIMAEEVRTFLNLDEVRFMPNKIPPHKNISVNISADHRMRMVSLAIKENPYFQLEAIELDRSGTSYSIDTIRILKNRDPDSQFFFIIGGDMVEYLPKWHKIEELVKLVQFVGVNRSNYDLKTPYNVQMVTIPNIDISSTLIRERLNKHQNVRYLIPQKVEEYIREEGLYGKA